MKYVDIVFDGPPSHESGRFVEVENESGVSVNVGEWIKRDDGYWALRIKSLDPPKPAGVIARPGDVLNSNVGTIWIVQTRGAYRRKMGHDIRAAHYPVQSACGSLCEQPINSGYMWMKDSGEPIAGYEDEWKWDMGPSRKRE
jgi:hypothetical protein